MSLEQLETLPTKRLLARMRQLHQCEGSLSFSDYHDASEASGVMFKDSPEWVAAYQQLKLILAGREHIPKAVDSRREKTVRPRVN